MCFYEITNILAWFFQSSWSDHFWSCLWKIANVLGHSFKSVTVIPGPNLGAWAIFFRTAVRHLAGVEAWRHYWETLIATVIMQQRSWQRCVSLRASSWESDVLQFRKIDGRYYATKIATEVRIFVSSWERRNSVHIFLFSWENSTEVRIWWQLRRPQSLRQSRHCCRGAGG